MIGNNDTMWHPDTDSTSEPKGLLTRKYGPNSQSSSHVRFSGKSPREKRRGHSGGILPPQPLTKSGMVHQGYDQRQDEDLIEALSRIAQNDDHSEGNTSRSSQYSTDSMMGMRKNNRESRQRPWTEKVPQRKREEGSFEVHYESFIPKNEWLQQRQYKYVNNPRWGDAYQIRRNKQKPFGPRTKDWLIENEFRVWLFEKSNKHKLQMNFGEEGPLPYNKQRSNKSAGSGTYTDLDDIDWERSRSGLSDEGEGQTRNGSPRGHSRQNKSRPLSKVHDSNSPRNSKRGSGKRGITSRASNLTNPSELKNVSGASKQIYENFYWKQIKADKEYAAATLVQKVAKGWLERAQWSGLKRRVLLSHGMSWRRFITEYKDMLVRIQQRYGVDSPAAPFSYKAIVQYLDKKEKYEQQFYRSATGDQIVRDNLMGFFHNCSLNPTEKELCYAYNQVFKGSDVKNDIVFLIDCSASVGERNFETQKQFVIRIINDMDIGPEAARVGFVAYNSECYQHFAFQAFRNKELLVKAIDEIQYRRGTTRTDRALLKARHMVEEARPGVHKSVILITDGLSTGERQDTIQQGELLKKLGANIITIGVGNSVDMTELQSLASCEDNILSIADYDHLSTLRRRLLDMLGQGPIQRDQWHRLDQGRGLTKTEALELLFTIYPPPGTDLDPAYKSTWTRPRVGDEEKIELQDMDEEHQFGKCLELVIESRIAREGKMTLPVGDGNDVIETSDYQEALKYARAYLREQKMKTDTTAEKERLLAEALKMAEGEGNETDDTKKIKKKAKGNKKMSPETYRRVKCMSQIERDRLLENAQTR